MPYWLTNMEHGVMPVYELSEVERHAKWGWSLLNEGESPHAKVTTAPVEVSVSEPEKPVKRKPGRPRRGE